MEDDALEVHWDGAGLEDVVRARSEKERGFTYLDEVQASAAYATHQRLEGHAPVVAVHRNFVCQRSVSGPLAFKINHRAVSSRAGMTYDNLHIQVSSAICAEISVAI